MQRATRHDDDGAGGGAEVAGARNGLRGLSARSAGWLLTLPGKLLLLTLTFVMLAEVLIFVPSIANFRVNFLTDRLRAAYLASLATDVAAGGELPQPLRQELLMSAGVSAIAVRSGGRRRMILSMDEPLSLDASFDLTPEMDGTLSATLEHRLALIRDALYVFVAPHGRTIRVYGAQAAASGETVLVEVVIEEATLFDAMLRHALNILVLSIIISIIAAALVYAALSRLLVMPMMRITRSMLRFAERPDDPTAIIEQSGRLDEIGVAERELARMQSEIAQALAERNRLAQLGLAVSKINHDLRNMLTSAQLMSDRLGTVQDPTVQRFAPKLIASLDRAIAFCNDSLKFGKVREAPPRRDVFPLGELVAEVAEALDLPRHNVGWRADIGEGLTVDADREHLHRILDNLVRNALEALSGLQPPAGTITVAAHRADRATVIEVSDDGPGIPEHARENLFRAFQGNARVGGTGLGLAIAQELTRAHGGEIELIDDAPGACFRITIPDRRTRGD